jgi:hypothetical protein
VEYTLRELAEIEIERLAFESDVMEYGDVLRHAGHGG